METLLRDLEVRLGLLQHAVAIPVNEVGQQSLSIRGLGGGGVEPKKRLRMRSHVNVGRVPVSLILLVTTNQGSVLLPRMEMEGDASVEVEDLGQLAQTGVR